MKDGGKSWTTLQVPSNIVGDAYFHDSKHGWAVRFLFLIPYRRGKQWNMVIANSTAATGPVPEFPMNYNKGPHNEGSEQGPLYVVNTKVAFMGGYYPACIC